MPIQTTTPEQFAPTPWHTGEDGAAIFDAHAHRILDVGRSRAHLAKRIVEAVNAFELARASSGGSTAPAAPERPCPDCGATEGDPLRCDSCRSPDPLR